MKTLRLDDLTFDGFWEVMAAHSDKITAVLKEWGPCTLEVLRYFLKEQYGINADTQLLMQMTISMRKDDGKPITNDGELYYLVGDENRTPAIPTVVDYAQAYITLYRRYQAIRENPALASFAEEYIDDLYRPHRRNQETSS